MFGMSTTRKNATSASDQSLNRTPGSPVTRPSTSDTASATGTATSSSLTSWVWRMPAVYAPPAKTATCPRASWPP